MINHDPWVMDGKEKVQLSDISKQEATDYFELVSLAEAGEIFAGNVIAHVDMKIDSKKHAYLVPAVTPREILVMEELIQYMEPSQIIVSSLNDPTILTLRRWARNWAPQIKVGLTLGLGQQWHTMYSTLASRKRLIETQSQMVVAENRLAKLHLHRIAEKLRLPMVVWTVDDPDNMVQWLTTPGVHTVVTDFPEIALDLRKQVYG